MKIKRAKTKVMGNGKNESSEPLYSKIGLYAMEDWKCFAIQEGKKVKMGSKECIKVEQIEVST